MLFVCEIFYTLFVLENTLLMINLVYELKVVGIKLMMMKFSVSGSSKSALE